MSVGFRGGIGLQLPVLAAHPAAPTTGAVFVYRLNDGLVYVMDDTGTPTAMGSGSGGTSDHGELTGLTDDDHPQYHTDVRGDARYASLGHNHDADYAAIVHIHDDRYYTETEADALLADKADASHIHDDRYYTETEADALLADKADTIHNHDADYAALSHNHVDLQVTSSEAGAVGLTVTVDAASTVDSIEIYRGTTLQMKLTADGDLYVYGTIYAEDFGGTL